MLYQVVTCKDTSVVVSWGGAIWWKLTDREAVCIMNVINAQVRGENGLNYCTVVEDKEPEQATRAA